MTMQVSLYSFVLGLLITNAYGDNSLFLSECHTDCGNELKITELQPFDSGCTLVQWSDNSSCSHVNTEVHYTLEILQNCDAKTPLHTMPFTNDTNHTVSIKSFNASSYNIGRPFHLRVKAQSDDSVCSWKSRCYAIHMELRINTTFCAANLQLLMQPCVSVPDMRTILCDRDSARTGFHKSLPHYYIGTKHQLPLEYAIKSNTFEDCFVLNVTDGAVLNGKCEYINARVNCEEHCNVSGTPEIIWRTVYLFSTDQCERKCLTHLENEIVQNGIIRSGVESTTPDPKPISSRFNLVNGNALLIVLLDTIVSSYLLSR